MTVHAPRLYGTYPAGGGIRCECGEWEDRISRDHGTHKVWTAYRRHWLDMLTYDQARRRLAGSAQVEPAETVEALRLFEL